nr:MAG: capsid protein [Astroviridae sp.]
MSSKEVVKVKNDNPKPQREGRSRTRSNSRGRNDGRSSSRGRRSLSRGRSNSKTTGTLTTGGRGTYKSGAIVRESISITHGNNTPRRPRSTSRGRWRGFGRGRGRGSWRGRGALSHVEKQITSLKKKVDGPKVAKQMKGTLTIGQVRGNLSSTQVLERKYHINTHPSILKDLGSGVALTPLTDTAKDYALWRLDGFHVRLMPLVNTSNVTGSIIVMSLDQNGDSSKDVNIDDLLTRPYCEGSIGQRIEWRIPPRLLEGPRQGWWLVDTNESGPDCLGPAIDVHVYGETFDLLKVSTTDAPLSPYGGPLWVVQIVYTFSFANYEPKPGMGVMDTAQLPAENIVVGDDGEGQLTATIVEPTGKLHTMTFRADPHFGKHTRGLKAVQAGESIGSTIWQVVTQAGETLADTVPGPWSWLIKGGLWFARRIFGNGENGINEEEDRVQFLLYPDFEQAQRDVRITSSGISTPIQLGSDDGLNVTQLNTTNVQNNETANQVANNNSYPVPVYYKSENLLKEQNGTIATGNATKSMWVLGGYLLDWNTPWGQSIEINVPQSVQFNTYVTGLKYGTQLRAVGGPKTAAYGGHPASGSQYSFGRIVTAGNWTGSGAIIPHHMLAPYLQNYHRGVLGDPLSLLKTLSSFPPGVKTWGGFYRVVSMDGDSGMPDSAGGFLPFVWPDWLQGKTSTPNNLWACVTACGDRYGYIDDNSAIIVDTVAQDVTIIAFWPFGARINPQWGGLPGKGTSCWYIITNNFAGLSVEKKVRFLRNEDFSDFSCSCAGACNCLELHQSDILVKQLKAFDDFIQQDTIFDSSEEVKEEEVDESARHVDEDDEDFQLVSEEELDTLQQQLDRVRLRLRAARDGDNNP